MQRCLPIVLTFLICLLPWLAQEQAKAINHDIAWLVEGASRLLEGRTMAGAVYDTNPPLSILIYIPALFFKNITGLSLENTVLLLTLFCAALSATASFLILRRWPALDFMDAVVFVCLFGIAATVFSYPDTGQRDQLIAFGLVPFILLQLALTQYYPCSRWLVWAVFITGSLLLMLKPNFGLLPTILLAHRMIAQKRFDIFRDPDFIALAVTATLYLMVVWFFFQDYIAVILTDVVDLYARFTHIGFLFRAAFWGAVYFLGFAAVLFGTKRMPEGQKRPLRILVFAALVNLIPYIIMMRGYSYHILPSLICFVTGVGFFVFLRMRDVAQPAIAAIVTFIFLSFVGYGLHAVPQVAKKQDLKALSVVQLVRDCGIDCKFWMLDESLRIIQQTAFYAERSHASRFPSLWFLKGMSRLKTGEPKKYKYYTKKYATMIAQDLKEYAPGLIISCVPEKRISFLFEDHNFLREWKKYKLDGTVEVDYRDYYLNKKIPKGRPLNCIVYRRINIQSAALDTQKFSTIAHVY
ncbi:MAG: hypothetical protein ACXW30_04815 [Micavibrio sp.]